MSKSATRQVSKPSKRKSRKKVLSRRGSSAQESPQKLMVSISGLRGIVGESLVPEVVVKYANAFAMFTGRKKIVIGRDGRYHGAMLAEILAGTLAANGCDVMDIGICPTPTVQLAAEHSDTAGGIAVTASHNPLEWNGLKFINDHGVFLDAEENKRLWSYVEKKTKYSSYETTGTIEHNDFFLRDHIRRVLAIKSVDVEAIRRRHFKVVVDCVNAAGSMVVPQLLHELGCITVKMNCDGSGKFPRKPEPLPENLTEIMLGVKSEGADLGIVVDPDVDRLVLITEKGEPFSEEYTIAQAVKFIFEKTPVEQRIAAVNLSTTRAVDKIARELDGKIYRSAVGEINVVKKMKEMNSVIGGEGSGGVILPEVHYGRDALVGIGITLQHLLEFGGTLSEMKNSLPKFEIVKKRIALGKKSPEKIIAAIKKHYSKFEMNTEDGLKIDAADYWIHLRKSNTEPIIRVIAEAATEKEARSRADEIENLVGSL
ncbi:MAG TPA: phosphoglucosamine mutase [Candidatus Acidoferrales bacterium]|nr:phosphoglucosamine mutase [Candidatus Acidoferrales bacterium]